MSAESKISGIYRIHNKKSKKDYIGQSSDLRKRKVLSDNRDIEKKNFLRFLQSYINKKLFGKDKGEFKNNFVKNISTPKKVNYRHKGILSLNKILEELEINEFQIISKRVRRFKKSRETYWMVVKRINKQ